jgi:ribosomal protein S24E
MAILNGNNFASSTHFKNKGATSITNDDNIHISYTITTSFIQKTIDENSNQNINDNNKTMVINGVVYSCSNEDFYKGKCDYDNNPPSKKDVVDKLRDDITNHKIDSLLPTSNDSDNEDLIIKENNTSYQITTSENQNYKVYHDISSIKLGECEYILKRTYNIDYKTPLIIFKIDNFVEGSQVPIIEYEIYDSINNTKLDLKHCIETKINISIPVSVDEQNIYKYDLSNNYYNDKCVPATSKDDTDIVLSDRIDEYYKQNMSLCEENCTYNGYNSELKKANCQCDVKTEINVENNSEFSKYKFLDYFIDIGGITNIDVLP